MRILFAVFIALAMTQTLRGNILTVGLVGTPAPRHPFLYEQDMHYAFYFLQTPMLRLNNTWKWECGLCVDVPTPENGLIEVKADYTLVTFEIKPHVTWADGSVLSGQDFVFAWHLFKKAEIKNSKFSSYAAIQGIKVDPANAKRITVKVDKDRNSLSALRGFFPLPEVLERPVWKKSTPKDFYVQDSQYVSKPFQRGLYNGSYYIEAMDSKEILLSRNPQAGTRFLKIRLRFFPDFASLKQDLTIDIIPESSYSAFCLESDCGSFFNVGDRYELVQGDSLNFEHVDFNLRNPILKDRNMRQALMQSLNFEELYDKVLKFPLSATSTSTHPRDPLFYYGAPLYDFNLKTAQKTLQNLNWDVDPATGIRQRNGVPLKIELITDETPYRLKIASYLKSSWKALGVDLEVVQLSAKELKEQIAKIDFRGCALYTLELAAMDFQEDLYQSKSIPTAANSYEGLNTTGWHNPKVDRFFKLLHGELTEEKVKKINAKVQEAYAEELPSIPLFFRMQMARIPKNLKGFTISGNDFPSSLDVDNWSYGRF